MAKGTFGERLKREREMREVSVDELTKATRISPRFLEALENEQWERLPGGVFGRGFVRTIARYLGLNEEGLLGDYDLARGDQKMEAPAPYENRIPSPPKWIPIVGVLLLLLILAGLVYGGRYAWKMYAAHRAARRASASLNPSETQNHTGSASVVPSVPSSATADPANPSTTALDLSVSTSAATRVRILADSKLLLDSELPAGETRHFFANQEFEVSAADSSAVLLELNGQVMRPLGTPGSSGTMVYGIKDLK